MAGVEQGVEGVVENEVKVEGHLLRTLCAMLRTLAFILRRGAIEGFLRGITFKMIPRLLFDSRLLGDLSRFWWVERSAAYLYRQVKFQVPGKIS